MRMTQIFGLSPQAGKYLKEHGLFEMQTCSCPNCKIPHIEIAVNEAYADAAENGMFDDGPSLFKHWLKHGIAVYEYIQAEPWSSGPCIFLALSGSPMNKDNNPILETLWNQESIDTAIDIPSSRFLNSKERGFTMSADNGIYVLETNAAPNGKLFGEKEYRVKHLQAIENVEYDELAPSPIRPTGDFHSMYECRPEDKEHCAYQEAYRVKFHSTNPDVHIRNARNMWKRCLVYRDLNKALLEAHRMEKEIMDSEYPILEYGVSTIRIDRVF